MTRATDLMLRLAEPGFQYVLLFDDSFYGTGFVLMNEDYVIDQKCKTHAPVSFALRLFTSTQWNFSAFIKNF